MLSKAELGELGRLREKQMLPFISAVNYVCIIHSQYVL